MHKTIAEIAADNMMRITLEMVVEALRVAAPVYKGHDGEFAITNIADAIERSIKKYEKRQDG